MRTNSSWLSALGVACCMLLAAGCGGSDGDAMPEECVDLGAGAWEWTTSSWYRSDVFDIGIDGDGEPFFGTSHLGIISFYSFDGMQWEEEYALEYPGSGDPPLYMTMDADRRIWLYDQVQVEFFGPDTWPGWEFEPWEEGEAFTFPAMVWDEEGNLFVAYTDTDDGSRISALRRDLSGTWTNLGSPSSTGSVTRKAIALDPADGHPLIAYTGGDHENETGVARWESGESWTDLGTALEGEPQKLALAVSEVDGSIVVVMTVPGLGVSAAVQWTGGPSWNDLGTVEGTDSSTNLQILFDGENRPVVLHGSSYDPVLAYTGTEWIDLGFPTPYDLDAADLLMGPVDGKPVVAYADPDNHGYPTVLKWDEGTTWDDWGVVTESTTSSIAAAFDPGDGALLVTSFDLVMHRRDPSSGTWEAILDSESPRNGDLAMGFGADGSPLLACMDPGESISVGLWGEHDIERWQDAGPLEAEGPPRQRSFVLDSRKRPVYTTRFGEVWRREEGTWSSLGPEPADLQLVEAAIVVDSMDTPYLLRTEDTDPPTSMVKMYESGAWIDLPLPDGIYAYLIAVDALDRPVVAYHDHEFQLEGYLGILRWDGSSWEELGFLDPNADSPFITTHRVEEIVSSPDGMLFVFYSKHEIDEMEGFWTFQSAKLIDDDLWCVFGPVYTLGHLRFIALAATRSSDGDLLAGVGFTDTYTKDVYTTHFR